jgi:hypothetical protein
MKTHSRLILLTLPLGAAAFLALFQFPPKHARGADPPAAEQYKIFNLGDGKFASVDQLEAELNKFATQGWKVRAGTSNLVILSK